MVERLLEVRPDVFWAFSVNWYERDGVMQQCLALQDQHAQNVNLLLLLAYFVQHQCGVSRHDWQTLSQAVQATDALLKAHRLLRREAKATEGSASPLYHALKAQELTLEQQQQADMLATLASHCTVIDQHTAKSIDEYLAFALPAKREEVKASLQIITKG